MGEYKISAIKYRPKTFKDVVGQEAVTVTLENALKKNKLGQALLFCGPRGVGKTTCARILAKNINFSDDDRNDYAFNIFELDAASNRSVDDIRSLNEQVRVPPRIGNYKVYIIDEVHMLTTEAFNAFLKTLEEPPAHTVFILATTEKSKILPTILSRCQIYDFKRISVLDIKKRLEVIMLKEKINYDDDALFLIAEGSDGSLRDGLQILDRMINFCESGVYINEVTKNLNIIGPKFYLEICKKIIEKNISEALVEFDKLISSGFDEINFIIGLSSHFRNLFFCKNNNTLKLIVTSDKIKDLYLEQADKIDLDWLKKALKITNSFETNFKNVDNKRIHAELCLIQISSIEREEKFKKKKIENIDIYDVDNKQKKIDKKNPQNYSLTENSKTETIEEIKREKKLPSEYLGVNEISRFSLASVEKKRTFENRKTHNGFSKSKMTSNENSFSQDDLEICWNNYHKIKLQNKELNIASILKISTPKKINNIIEYSVTSEINKRELENQLPEILDYFKSKLKNDHIKIKINTTNSIKKNILFTASEKFKKLAELNPSIKKLKKKLDLDY